MLIFIFVVEMGFHQVLARLVLNLLMPEPPRVPSLPLSTLTAKVFQASSPPPSASQSAGITGMSHRTQHPLFLAAAKDFWSLKGP